jgi:hypothetical protein
MVGVSTFSLWRSGECCGRLGSSEAVDAYNPFGDLGKILLRIIVGNIIKIDRQVALFQGQRAAYLASGSLIFTFRFHGAGFYISARISGTLR